MRTWMSALVGCVALAACAGQQRVDTSQLPPFFYGSLVDNGQGAINEASYDLGSPARTRGDPVAAIRVALAIEFLAGDLNTDPRWADLSPIAKMDMLDARKEVRQILGIAPNAPSQPVVNQLLRVLVDMSSGNMPDAMQALAAPPFTLPPEQTLQVLQNLPVLPAARVATSEAQLQSFGRP